MALCLLEDLGEDRVLAIARQLTAVDRVAQQRRRLERVLGQLLAPAPTLERASERLRLRLFHGIEPFFFAHA